MSVKVSLRQKGISKGRKSLYLDFYPAIISLKTGKSTRREFLNMYVVEKPTLVSDKKHKKETLRIAEAIRKKRENELNKPEIYTKYEQEQLELREKGKRNFVDYFQTLAKTRKGSTRINWISAHYYLETYTKGYIEFNQLSVRYFDDFKAYLLTVKSRKSINSTLAINTALSYFNKIKAGLKQAYIDGYLDKDINAQIKPIKEEETKREYLTIEELNQLNKTNCINDMLKKISMFSALTGLRFSDIQKLKWSEVREDKGNYFLHFQQQKTKGHEVQPIPEQAFKLLGERMEGVHVFEGLKYSAYHNKQLKKWLLDAGITKKITFHCFRHTYATLQLSHGTDLYTVSKMLGHKNIKTTQIYAKVVNELKQQTIDKIKLDI